MRGREIDKCDSFFMIGCSRDRLLVSGWPSAEMGRTFWYSEEYGAVRRLGEGAGEVHPLLAESLSPSRSSGGGR
jgi:hypothetical protein